MGGGAPRQRNVTGGGHSAAHKLTASLATGSRCLRFETEEWGRRSGISSPIRAPQFFRRAFGLEVESGDHGRAAPPPWQMRLERRDPAPTETGAETPPRAI
jgi:hypothetical protein